MVARHDSIDKSSSDEKSDAGNDPARHLYGDGQDRNVIDTLRANSRAFSELFERDNKIGKLTLIDQNASSRTVELKLSSSQTDLPELSLVEETSPYRLPDVLAQLGRPKKGQGYYEPIQASVTKLLDRRLSDGEIRAIISGAKAMRKENGLPVNELSTRDLILPSTEKDLKVFLDNIGNRRFGKQFISEKTLESLLKEMKTKLGEDESPQESGGVRKPEKPVETPIGSDKHNMESQIPTAKFKSVQKEGKIDQMVSGTIRINGNDYEFNSGGQKRGSLPEGEYDITVGSWTKALSASFNNIDGVGYTFNMSNKYDPRVAALKVLDPKNRSMGYTRFGLQIHPDGGNPGTQGCIGIVGDASVQRRFREDMKAEFARNGKTFKITVGGLDYV